MKTAMIICAIVLGLFLLVFFGAGYFMFHFAVVREKKGQRQIDYWKEGTEDTSEFIQNMEEGTKNAMCASIRRIRSYVNSSASIVSRDGLKLEAKVIENEKPTGVAVLMHGYRSSAAIDFSPVFEALLTRGFTLLMPDQRAHGDSEGKYIGYGVLERFDVVDWVKYAEEKWNLPILVYGVSMGSATVMMGCNEGYPKSVRAIIADCGFTSAGDICKTCMKNWFKVPAFPVYYGAKFWTKVIAKYDLDSVTARKSLEKLRGTGTKVMFAHGKADDFVPFWMTEENMKAFDYMPESVRREAIELVAVEDAGHAQSYTKGACEYIDAIDRLLAKAHF